MPHRPPTFNLTCRLWHQADPAAPPPSGTPDLDGVPCQLYLPQPAAAGRTQSGGGVYSCLRLPAKTDIRPTVAGSNFGDIVEVPRGSGRYYTVEGVEDAHKGFPNEYRVAIILSRPLNSGYWPVPTP